jgi:predicted AlkP superfamily phosphohydrolase/phosphomutase
MSILVIGLDGATWTVLKPLMDEGVMPYLSRLCKQGTSGILKSTIPPITPVAWVSFQTGVMPGKHGVYGFQHLSRTTEGFKFVMTDSSSIKARTFWEYAGSLGKRVHIVNLPMTYPPAPIHGSLVTGFPTPSQQAEFTYPQALKQELLKEVPSYQVPTPDFGGIVKEDRITDYVERLIQMAKARAQAALFLMHKHPWDIMVLQFQETDFLQHPFWHYLDRTHPYFSEAKRETVARFFREIDKLVELVSRQLMGDGLLMLVSDHGFQSMNRIFFPNRWLHQEGYLKLDTNPKEFAYQASLSTLRSLDIFKLRRLFFRDSARNRLAQELVRRKFNWERSLVYAHAEHTGDFYLYLTKRDAKAQQELIEKLLYETIDPKTGEKVVDRVLTSKEAFGSELAVEPPDLIVRLKEGYIAVPNMGLKPGPLFESRNPGQDYQIGVHHPDGIILAKGTMIERGVDSLLADIIDIAPTLLYHLDLPIPSGLDGKVLREIYNPEYLQAKETSFTEQGRQEPRTSKKQLTNEEKEQIRERLRQLGYM